MYIKDHNKCALIDGDRHISYSEVVKEVKEYSKLFARYKGKRIALFCENRPEWIYAFFAAWNVGATLVLFDSMSTVPELEYMISDSGVVAVCTSDQKEALIADAKKRAKSRAKLINLNNVKIPARSRDVAEHEPLEDEIVLMLYTSGTSGTSKGVMLSWKNLMKNVRWNNDSKRINETDRMIAILPNHHSWPLIATVLCPLECGATVVFLPKLDAETLVSTIADNNVTMVTAVPRLFELLHGGIMKKVNESIVARIVLAFCKFLYLLPFNRLFGRVKFPYTEIDIIPLTRKLFKKVHEQFGGQIKTFISGGAKLDEKIINDFRAMGILMLEGYGLTETAPMITYHPFDAQLTGSVGKVFDEIDLKIEEDGEILLKGDNVFKEYWNKPDDTKAAFTKEGYYRTGDLGRLDKNGYLFLTGRKKDIIILSNGKNVRPDIIEAKIQNSSQLVSEIAVTQSKNSLVAIVVPDTSFARREKISNIAEYLKFEVIDEYNKSVENYKKIHDVIISTEELPKTRMGKIKRYKLDSFLSNERRSEKEEHVERPGYDEYGIIEHYLEKRTGINVYPDDHIELDLGLDSLEIVELRLFVEKSFGVKIDEENMADYSIVKDLAEYAHTSKQGVNETAFDLKDILAGESSFKVPESRWMLDIFNRYFSLFYKGRINLAGKGEELVPEGPCILAPNHSSYLDSIVVYHLLHNAENDDLYFLAKEKNFRNPFFKLFADNARVIVMDINKNLQMSLQNVAEVLRQGKKVLIFPEGTRSRTGSLQRFKNTFASISKALDVPVIPVAIKGAYEAMPYTKKLPGRGDVSVEFLAPVKPDGLSEEEIVDQTFALISQKVDPEAPASAVRTKAAKKSGPKGVRKASKRAVKKTVKKATKKSVKKKSE